MEPFERKLSAKRVGPTYLVEITFESRDPDRAAQISTPLQKNILPIKWTRAGLQDEQWVKDRLNELSTQASAAKKALEDFGRIGKMQRIPLLASIELAAAAESSKTAYDNFRLVLRKTEATRQ